MAFLQSSRRIDRGGSLKDGSLKRVTKQALPAAAPPALGRKSSTSSPGQAGLGPGASSAAGGVAGIGVSSAHFTATRGGVLPQASAMNGHGGGSVGTPQLHPQDPDYEEKAPLSLLSPGSAPTNGKGVGFARPSQVRALKCVAVWFVSPVDAGLVNVLMGINLCNITSSHYMYCEFELRGRSRCIGDVPSRESRER